MDRPHGGRSALWFGLWELFESASGLKLRINVADTVIVKDGRALGWFYTSRDGVVVRAMNHEISSQAIFQKIAGSQGSCNANLNPNRYVALAHFESGIARPLKQPELHALLQNITGPYDTSYQWPDELTECPFCIQAYVPPLRDLRYIASFGGPEGLQACTTFARRFSLRYTHATDAPAPSTPQQQALLHGRPPRTVAAAATHEPPPLTSEEMLVESQLVALGLLEPREAAATTRNGVSTSMSLSSDGAEGGMVAAEASLPVSKAVKAEVLRAVATLQSFIERAHGLRMQGLVAEFLQSTPDTVVLLAVHAVQWDTRASRGRLGTFTDRWTDFLAGQGPAPAAQPTTKRNFAPAMLSTSIDSQASGSAMPEATDTIMSGRGYPFTPSGVRVNASTAIYDARPGSAPTVLLHRYKPNPYVPGAANGAVAKHLTGAGSVSLVPQKQQSENSYALWMPRDMLATDTIAGTLALELEVVRDKLARQTSVTARAEAALGQMAVASKEAHAALVAQIEGLRSELAELKARKLDATGEYERLRSERAGLKSEIATTRESVKAARAVVDQERVTLVAQVRAAQSKEESMEEEARALRVVNEELSQQVGVLQRKAEEGNEVVDAVKTQLLDYRSMVIMLQSQLRRGKNNLTLASGVQASTAQSVVGDDEDQGVTRGGRNAAPGGANRYASGASVRPGSGMPGRLSRR